MVSRRHGESLRPADSDKANRGACFSRLNGTIAPPDAAGYSAGRAKLYGLDSGMVKADRARALSAPGCGACQRAGCADWFRFQFWIRFSTESEFVYGPAAGWLAGRPNTASRLSALISLLARL